MEETDFNFVRTKIIGENQKEHAIKLTPAELDPIDLSKEEEIQLIEESTALKKTVLELITKAEFWSSRRFIIGDGCNFMFV